MSQAQKREHLASNLSRPQRRCFSVDPRSFPPTGRKYSAERLNSASRPEDEGPSLPQTAETTAYLFKTTDTIESEKAAFQELLKERDKSKDVHSIEKRC